jgi:hypothetical protein
MAIQIWQPGDKINNDRFHILKHLKPGGFGITYLVEDTIKKQQVVIKTLNAGLWNGADFEEEQEKFIEEGFKLRGFNHSHIVKAYKQIKIDNLRCLVMEYIHGQDLNDYVEKKGRLNEIEALLYIDQISQALDCVHQENIFHRDVHPGNIMKRQDRDEVVLIDFGIAREFFDTTCSVSNIHGRHIYKPVEQYEKVGRFGAYTDIYSLTVTLYYLLIASDPLHKSIWRKDNRDTEYGIQAEEHMLERLAKVGVSPQTQVAIKAGMGIEPSERPQTITEFRELLGLVSTSPITTSRSDDQILIFNPKDSSLDETGDIGSTPLDFDNQGDSSKDDVADFQDKAIDLIPDLSNDDPLNFESLPSKSDYLLKGANTNLLSDDTKPEIADLDTSNLEIDTLDHDLDAITFGDFDEDPFASLSDLFGEATILPSSLNDEASELPVDGKSRCDDSADTVESKQAVQPFLEENNALTSNRDDVAVNLHSEGQITLVSHSLTQAYAHWEIPMLKHKLREKGGQKLVVRLYDVTNVDSNIAVPKTFRSFECDDSDWDLAIPIITSEHCYLAEIGCTTADESWVMLARSAPLWIRKSDPQAGLAAGTSYSEGQITLVSSSLTQAYAHWEIPVRLKRQLREQGGQKMVVRLYDVTNVDSNIESAATFKEFECDDSDWDLEIPITTSEHRYLTEIGYVTADGSWLMLARSAPLWISKKDYSKTGLADLLGDETDAFSDEKDLSRDPTGNRNDDTSALDRDLEAISLDGFDKDPLAGLVNLLGDKTDSFAYAKFIRKEKDKDKYPSVDLTDLSTGEKVVSDLLQKKGRFASLADLFVENRQREKENPFASLADVFIKISERGDFW